jgi:hypothetical protein
MDQDEHPVGEDGCDDELPVATARAAKRAGLMANGALTVDDPTPSTAPFASSGSSPYPLGDTPSVPK